MTLVPTPSMPPGRQPPPAIWALYVRPEINLIHYYMTSQRMFVMCVYSTRLTSVLYIYVHSSVR